MKSIRSIFLAIFLSASMLMATNLAYASNGAPNPLDYLEDVGAGAGYVIDESNDLRTNIANIIQVLLGLLGIIAVALILYGGFMWMTSQGESSKVETAKKIIINAAIGLIIILIAYSITYFIIYTLQSEITGV